jgi:hypothetical protein
MPDWLPARREEQIALSKNWQTILTAGQTPPWDIPMTEVTVLRTLTTTAETPPDPHHSDYGFRVYFGILSPGGATLGVAAGPKREWLKPPVSGDELPHSHFTRRKRERMDFAQ